LIEGLKKLGSNHSTLLISSMRLLIKSEVLRKSFSHITESQGARMTTEVVDNYLEHYGVKGMKWGKHQRSSSSGSSSSGGSAEPQKKSRKELRALDRAARKESKAQARKAWDADINKARDELDGKAQKLNEAQKQYKTNKATMGKVAAKHILRDHEDDFIETWNKASLQTTKEAQTSMIAGVGLLALSAVVPIAASAARNSW
jgi:hypothetical protein